MAGAGMMEALLNAVHQFLVADTAVTSAGEMRTILAVLHYFLNHGTGIVGSMQKLEHVEHFWNDRNTSRIFVSKVYMFDSNAKLL